MLRRRGRPLTGRQPLKCVCPVCRKEVAKPAGTPCRTMKCPKCGNPMIRAGAATLAPAKTSKTAEEENDKKDS